MEVSLEWMRNEMISVDYSDEKLELQFPFVSTCMQSCMIPKEHCAIVVFTVADVKLL